MSEKLEMHELFTAMAKQELEEILSRMPSDPTEKFVLFIETLRVLDYWTVFQPLLPEERCLTPPDFELLHWGWNLAAAHLFTAVQMPGAIPIMESTEKSRSSALNLLRLLGQTVLMRRASEMIRIGFLVVESTSEGFTVRKVGNTANQFLDNIEFAQLEKMETTLNTSSLLFSKGWMLIDIEDYSNLPSAAGFYFARSRIKELDTCKGENIRELMSSLVSPWDSGHGVMMGYGALPEVDNHFFSLATKWVIKWRAEAGIHPEANLGAIKGSDLTAVIFYLSFLHLKHINFALAAMKSHPDISIPQSLTIWGPLEDLVDSIVDQTSLGREVVRRAVDAVTLHPDDVSHFHDFTTPFVPLLISLDNGLVLRPVSSIGGNPFHSAVTLQTWRDPTIRNRISAPREDWMRADLYGVFQGTRYRRVEGNIKLRSGGRILTDIDAAVLDSTTGELALFQIKWQDYFTNDVRELRSKARNLTKEMDEWSEKVTSWIGQKGNNELIKTLRLKLRKGLSVSSVYLFGISRNSARMHGFGYSTENENLAIANWPQFLRIRFEIGPAERVFQQLFDTLRLKMYETIITKSLPLTVKVSGKSICFEDLWNILSDEEEGE